MTKILVVAAHPDDEILGCGATIAKKIKQGFDVRTIILTTGVTSRYDGSKDSEEEIQSLFEEGKKANGILGVSKNQLVYAKFPDQKLDTIPEIELIRYIKNEVQSFKPDEVYTHHSGDYNLDHRITFNAVNFATRPYQGEHFPRKVLTFEVLSSTEWANVEKNAFVPNHYEKLVQADIDAKKNAMTAYKSELRIWPNPRSIEGVEVKAKQRGMEISSESAEAFKIIRSIGD